MGNIIATKDNATAIGSVKEQGVLEAPWVDYKHRFNYKLPIVTITSATTTNIESTSHGLTESFNIRLWNATDGLKDGLATVADVNNIDISAVVGVTVAPTKAYFDKSTEVAVVMETTPERCVVVPNQYLEVL